ncbi:DUF1513 domain-containing protein [Methylobacterium iners]|uniref:DUF1513 domain-containing protein n=1 Tax=Methylobacterium iners TaxID=418707 RepID=A0ABQ4S1N5_9HYPH|nr:DUF1513 domain-containing protein [Methylobacterium iners]GJD96092.1 hypothetical protein OCOJLMKI_3310 [Methylobacterium iners]
MLDRRSFLASLGAALAAGLDPRAARAGAAPPVFVSAAMESGDGEGAAIAAFDLDGGLLFRTRLPARGHDVTARPGSPEIVVFARRPGNWAAVVDRGTGTVGRVITTPPERHFFGHGTFSPDGRLLYATENRVRTGEGALGLYDATAGYRRVGELPTHGIGPHDLALMAGGLLLVANGGTRTHPETGREILNPDGMRPSLALIDPSTGEARNRVDLGPALRPLSIRHLAVAGDGEAVFACQWEGDRAEGSPLVGLLDRSGATRFLDMPEEDLASLDNYVGSVALSASEGIIAATSPRGGTAAFWERASGRYLGRRPLRDVCGIAPVRDGPGAREAFLVSSGHEGARVMAIDAPEARRLAGALPAMAWDNHLRRL